MLSKKFSPLIILLLQLSGCTLLMPAGSWPEGLPPREYFVDYYQASEDNHAYQSLDDYLYWIQVFYEGNALSPGWIHLSSELVFEAEEDRKVTYARKMQTLGRLIAAEWAQNNNVRLIDTRCASIWRDALLEAVSRDDLDNYIQRFEADVNAILAGELSKGDIQLERYYEVEEFDFF